ncbi:MAG: hypothetical protein R8L07_03350 [Alphaproteobacteria bacterium]|nr:hypothetical protein [Alphaproteobacteria bacterium]
MTPMIHGAYAVWALTMLLVAGLAYRVAWKEHAAGYHRDRFWFAIFIGTSALGSSMTRFWWLVWGAARIGGEDVVWMVDHVFVLLAAMLVVLGGLGHVRTFTAGRWPRFWLKWCVSMALVFTLAALFSEHLG